MASAAVWIFLSDSIPEIIVKYGYYLAKLVKYGLGIGDYRGKVSNELVPRIGDLFVVHCNETSLCSVIYGPMKRDDGSEMYKYLIDIKSFEFIMNLNDDFSNSLFGEL